MNYRLTLIMEFEAMDDLAAKYEAADILRELNPEGWRAKLQRLERAAPPFGLQLISTPQCEI